MTELEYLITIMDNVKDPDDDHKPGIVPISSIINRL